jgi:nucleotide-binding universal stress UspA family protein
MQQLRSIVVATDFSALAEAAAARASCLARLEAGAVHLVHAVGFPLIAAPYEISLPPAVWESVRQAAREKLEQTRKAVEASGVQTVTAELADSRDPVPAISAAARAHAADLVVMGTHGHRGLQRAFLGSVAERALRSLDGPVLAVKEDPEAAARPIQKILLAVDFSAHSERAVEVTAALAARLRASVDLLHAFELPHDFNPYLSRLGIELEQKIEADRFQRLERVRERLAQRQVQAKLHLVRGRADTLIAEVAREAGSHLIAMGTRGNSGISHVLLGSVAERTLRLAGCSVLCVKAGEKSGPASRSA